MNVWDKITNYDSLSELEEAIGTDLKTHDTLALRYGVRFILLDNFDTFRSLTRFLRGMGVVSINIKNSLPADNPNSWITTGDIINMIENCTKSTVISPLSEILRFYSDNDFRGIVNHIILSETSVSKNIRIYIPLIGLNNRFSDFLRQFGRLAESGPIWQCYTGEQQVKIFIPEHDFVSRLKHPSLFLINNFYEYLEFPETVAPKDKIICRALPVRVKYKDSKSDKNFSFIPLANSYEFLTQFVNLELPIKYEEADEDCWKELLEHIDGKNYPCSFNFDDFVKNHFNRVKLDVDSFLEEWAREEMEDRFDRWLLKQYFLNSTISWEEPYLRLCLTECKELGNPEALFIKLADRVFYDIESAEHAAFIQQRRRIMQSKSSLFRSLVPDSNQDKIEKYILEISHNCFSSAVALCTGTFDFENSLAIEWYSNSLENLFTEEMLCSIFPDMEYYLSDIRPGKILEKQIWSLDYFKSYRQAKIRDIYSDDIENFIKDKNKDAASFYSWYQAFNESNDALACFKPDRIYWLDGVGAEFLPYILNYIEKSRSGFQIIHSEITRCNIPSITELNRFVGENVDKNKDQDDEGHKRYEKFHTLIREIHHLKTKLNKIVSHHKTSHSTFAIVSDHGFTCLSRSVESRKYDDNIYHDGRYIEVKDGNPTHDSDYVVHRNETNRKKYKVALKHNSLGVKPVREVHGGCTPEEVLVPFVIVSNETELIYYTITVKNQRVPLSDAAVSVSIMPDPGSVKLDYQGKQYQMERNINTWSTRVTNPKEGKQKLRIIPKNGFPHEIEIEFYGLGFGKIEDVFDL